MYSVGDIIRVLLPDEPPIGSTVRGSITLKEYQRNLDGWVYLYAESYTPLTWEGLLLKETGLEVTSVPFQVGDGVSTTEKLNLLPIGTVMTVEGGNIPYVKTQEKVFLRFIYDTAKVMRTKDIGDIQFVIAYLPEEEEE